MYARPQLSSDGSVAEVVHEVPGSLPPLRLVPKCSRLTV